MAVTPKRARDLALSLAEASAAPHFDRIAFRTPRRTFATLALSGVDINFMLDLVQQADFCKRAPQAIAPVAGGWGRMGWTRCDLKLIDLATLKAALAVAHARAHAPKLKAQPKPKAQPKLKAQATRKSQPKATAPRAARARRAR